MTNAMLTRPEALVAAWRSGADNSSPAGPLFSSPYAEFDLTNEVQVYTTISCSSCSASRTVYCC